MTLGFINKGKSPPITTMKKESKNEEDENSFGG